MNQLITAIFIETFWFSIQWWQFCRIVETREFHTECECSAVSVSIKLNLNFKLIRNRNSINFVMKLMKVGSFAFLFRVEITAVVLILLALSTRTADSSRGDRDFTIHRCKEQCHKTKCNGTGNNKQLSEEGMDNNVSMLSHFERINFSLNNTCRIQKSTASLATSWMGLRRRVSIFLHVGDCGHFSTAWSQYPAILRESKPKVAF